MKKSVGFVISHKENENRRALIPSDVKKIKNKSSIFIEKGYGEVLGFSDDEYLNMGIGGLCNRDEILKKDILCDPKIGDGDYLNDLDGQTIFGWIHAVQNKDITDRLISRHLTVYAWEDMFSKGRHCFWRNNEIAGEAAVSHAYMCYGVFPYNTKVAVIGRGNTARGAIKTLNYMGAEVVVYDRHTEQLFREELENYDVIVNAILWDTKRNDHLIYKEDLKRMKKNSMIIDISCDRAGGIETSIPTTIDNPVYMVDGVMHYVVDHTPSLFFKTTSESLSGEVAIYIDDLIQGEFNEVLNNALIVKNGEIIDKRIKEFQHRF